MKQLLLALGMAAAVAATSLPASAQRRTDTLGRGLVAVKRTGGVFLSWRITAEEYYDVTYNVYRDGTLLNEEPLDVSNFTDKGGTVDATYTVRPVVRGAEGDLTVESNEAFTAFRGFLPKSLPTKEEEAR